MKLIHIRFFLILIIISLILPTGPASAEEEAATKDAAQANNPLANMTAFNLQNYYIGELTESDKDANQFWLRFARPFSVAGTNWLMRASLPVNTFPTPPEGDTKTGLGDFNVFAAYLFDTGNPAVSFGLGPQLTAPTATKDELGSEKWSAGFANVLFNECSAPGHPRERVIVTAKGQTAVVDDFAELSYFGKTRKNIGRNWKKQMGHEQALAAFVAHLRGESKGAEMLGWEDARRATASMFSCCDHAGLRSWEPVV